MIIIPPGFLLSQEATTTPLTHARIGYQTFTRGRTDANISVNGQADGSLADAPLRPDTYEYWQGTHLPATWRIDLGSAKEVDYVGVAGHTIGSESCSIAVEYSSNLLDWSPFSLDTAPATNAPLLFLDEIKFARYWRIVLDNNISPIPVDAPQVAVIYIGKALAMQRAIYAGHTPINLSRQTVLKQTLSRGGKFLGQNIMRGGVKTDASFKNLKADWVRQYFDPFVLSARRYPYFFGWRPQTFPSEVGYVWTADDIAPSNQGVRDFMQVGWSMVGISNGD